MRSRYRADRISIEAAETCLLMMFYSFPSKKIALPLVSLLSKLNEEPSLAEGLNRLYSFILNRKLAGTELNLSQIPPDQLSKKASLSWQKERMAKNQEIANLNIQIQVLKKDQSFRSTQEIDKELTSLVDPSLIPSDQLLPKLSSLGEKKGQQKIKR